MFDALAGIAGGLTTAALIPQVVYVYRTKSVRDLSFLSYAVSTSGMALYCFYSGINSLWTLFFGNFLTTILLCAILFAKIYYGVMKKDESLKGEAI